MISYGVMEMINYIVYFISKLAFAGNLKSINVINVLKAKWNYLDDSTHQVDFDSISSQAIEVRFLL